MSTDGGFESGLEPDCEPRAKQPASEHHVDPAAADSDSLSRLNASPEYAPPPPADDPSLAPPASLEEQAPPPATQSPDSINAPLRPFLVPRPSSSPAGPEDPFSTPAEPDLSNQLPPTQPDSPALFQNWEQIELAKPVRIPNFGHLGLLALLLVLGLLASSALVRSALHFHLFGVSTVQQAVTEIHYALGSEVILYLFTLLGCLVIFPLVWHRGLFDGLQWNGATAYRMRKHLFGAAFVCFIVALCNGLLMPGPENAPIDKIFRAPGAAWLLFGFGVTVAPFFEELMFRGFLLPALCTSFDWARERAAAAPMLPLAPDGHPQWTLPAMVFGSVATSIPFALMHAAQTGYAVGPLILLVCVSLVLCWTRLATRSLAASVLVHASYNFLLFSLMMLSTEGFRHLNHL